MLLGTPFRKKRRPGRDMQPYTKAVAVGRDAWFCRGESSDPAARLIHGCPSVIVSVGSSFQ